MLLFSSTFIGICFFVAHTRGIQCKDSLFDLGIEQHISSILEVDLGALLAKKVEGVMLHRISTEINVKKQSESQLHYAQNKEKRKV
jgi:hypothetical protein